MLPGLQGVRSQYAPAMTDAGLLVTPCPPSAVIETWRYDSKHVPESEPIHLRTAPAKVSKSSVRRVVSSVNDSEQRNTKSELSLLGQFYPAEVPCWSGLLRSSTFSFFLRRMQNEG